MGMPKALMRTPAGEPWLHLSVAMLNSAGCDPIIVVLGAGADEAKALLPPSSSTSSAPNARVEIVVADRWADGMSQSVRAGIGAAAGRAVLIALVDMPDLPGTVINRLLAEPITATSLRQAVFGGIPGHPVLIGQAHWRALLGNLSGDRGARAFLAANGITELECGDLYDGHDQDTPRTTASTTASTRTAPEEDALDEDTPAIDASAEHRPADR